MKYISIKWTHNDPKDPTDIYTEIDDQQWEHRKIEMFRDGHYGFADKTKEVGESMLGTEPWPDLAKLGKEPEFNITEITKEEFEQLWLKVTTYLR